MVMFVASAFISLIVAFLIDGSYRLITWIDRKATRNNNNQ